MPNHHPPSDHYPRTFTSFFLSLWLTHSLTHSLYYSLSLSPSFILPLFLSSSSLHFSFCLVFSLSLSLYLWLCLFLSLFLFLSPLSLFLSLSEAETWNASTAHSNSSLCKWQQHCCWCGVSFAQLFRPSKRKSEDHDSNPYLRPTPYFFSFFPLSERVWLSWPFLFTKFLLPMFFWRWK